MVVLTYSICCQKQILQLASLQCAEPGVLNMILWLLFTQDKTLVKKFATKMSPIWGIY